MTTTQLVNRIIINRNAIQALTTRELVEVDIELATRAELATR